MTWEDALAVEKQQAYFVSLLSKIKAERKAGKDIYPAQDEVSLTIFGHGDTFEMISSLPDSVEQFLSLDLGRPILLAFQDIYSRKILSWRLDETENVDVDNCAHQVLLKLESMGLIKG